MDTTATLAGIARLAARQHGAFTRAQAEGCGLAPSTVSRRVNAGRWRQLQRGVYCEAATPDSWELRASAVVLALGGEAALARSSAARLWGLTTAPRDDRLHVVVHSRRARGLRGVEVHRTGTLHEDQVTRRSGLRVTVPARTVVDLAGSLRPRQVRGLVSQVVRLGLTNAAEITRTLDLVGRVRGAAALREAVELLVPGEEAAASELEARFLRLVTQDGLAPTHLNLRVRDADGVVRYLDAVYLPERLVVELDGAAYHTLGPDRANDAERERALAAAGWSHILRFTWHHVTVRPDWVLRSIRDALGRPSSPSSGSSVRADAP